MHADRSASTGSGRSVWSLRCVASTRARASICGGLARRPASHVRYDSGDTPSIAANTACDWPNAIRHSRSVRGSTTSHHAIGVGRREAQGWRGAYFSQPIFRADRSLCSPHIRRWSRGKWAKPAISLGTWRARQGSNLRPRLRRPVSDRLSIDGYHPRRLDGLDLANSRLFLAELRRFIASHAITDRRDDHVIVARPHPEPAMRSPCSLGRVPTSVTTSSASCARPPAIIEDLHTIADLRDPDQIRRDSDAGATRWPRGGQGWVDSTPRVRERSHEAGARTDICSGRPPAEGSRAPRYRTSRAGPCDARGSL